MFYRHDMYNGKKEVVNPEDYIEVNIGSKTNSRMIKIAMGTYEHEKKDLI